MPKLTITPDAHISASVQNAPHQIQIADKLYYLNDVTVNVSDGTDDQYSDDVSLTELIELYIAMKKCNKILNDMK